MKKWIVTAFAAFSTLIGLQAQTWQVGNTTLTESDLVTGLTLPWEITWGPDNYIWCTTRPGLLLRIDPETGNYTTVLNKSTVVPNDGDGEPGMLGMALHPDFLNTPTVFVVYNYMSGNSVKERLAAFTWDGSALVNEVTLIDAIGGNYIHNGSRLLITPDQKILMTTGDTGDGGASSQNLNSKNGKTLRINLDGSIPSDNPDPASYVWSYGHRNGQGLCIGPNGIIYESEHGQSNSDEFNIIEPNRNYGWPNVEGACNTTAEQTYCANNNVREPLLEWSPCRAVNGLEYYNHPAVPEWNNCVLMAVLGGLSSNYERMTVIHLSEDGLSATSVDAEDSYFQSFNRRIRDLCVNPTTGELFVAFNGASYPGSGPNAIKKFSNLEYLGVQNYTVKGQNISLFPNPIEDTARLEFSSSFLGATCQVFSFSGQLMGEFKVDQTNMGLDCTNYAPGNYFLSATSAEGTISRTFVVK